MMIRIYKIDSTLKAVLCSEFHIEKCRIVEVVVSPIVGCQENVSIRTEKLNHNQDNKEEITHLLVSPTKKQTAMEREQNHFDQ
ncbi:MAG: hypothetical protein EA392_11855 [Cryomorphaceae bacterium]|nr:MAG: hypothetical protein EA392_11855 [Cryomorphaceae bacterium]